MTSPSLLAVRLAFAASAVLAGAAAARAQTTVLPGYWESTNSVSLLVSSKSTTRKCLTAAEVNEWITNPSTKHYSCVYDHRQIADGHASFRGVCTDHKGHQAKVAITGDYQPEHFVLNAHLKYHLTAGIDVPVVATTDAHRLSATCPE